MNTLVLFLIGFTFGMIGAIIAVIIFDRKMIHNCSGMIVMSGNEMYLALSDEDKEAFKSKGFATLRLHRENFNGFNE